MNKTEIQIAVCIPKRAELKAYFDSLAPPTFSENAYDGEKIVDLACSQDYTRQGPTPQKITPITGEEKSKNPSVLCITDKEDIERCMSILEPTVTCNSNGNPMDRNIKVDKLKKSSLYPPRREGGRKLEEARRNGTLERDYPKQWRKEQREKKSEQSHAIRAQSPVHIEQTVAENEGPSKLPPPQKEETESSKHWTIPQLRYVIAKMKMEGASPSRIQKMEKRLWNKVSNKKWQDSRKYASTLAGMHGEPSTYSRPRPDRKSRKPAIQYAEKPHGFKHIDLYS